MVTIATCKQFIEQHPDDSLMDTFALDDAPPSSYDTWFNSLQNIYIAWLGVGKTATLPDFCLAVYTYWTTPANAPNWPDRVTSAQLTKALTDLRQPNQDGTGPSPTPAFAQANVPAEVNKWYLDISIVVDADQVLSEYNNTVAELRSINDSRFLTMTDNHPSTSWGEGSDELASEGLQPNMTVTWTATSKNNDHAIELIEYLAEDGSRYQELFPMPVQMPGQPQTWVTKANATLPTSYSVTYAFHLKIDNGAAIYWFDPYIGDLPR